MIYYLSFCKHLVADGFDLLSQRTFHVRSYSVTEVTEHSWEDYSTVEKADATPYAGPLILGISGQITQTVIRVVLFAISLSLSLVTHILISVVFKLASRKSINPELAKATILCLDVMAFAVGEMARPWFVLRNIRARKDHFWHFLLEELGYT